MIMRPGQQLLLPANPLFIWSTLLAALLLDMLQNMGLWGRAAWAPDLLALVLVFWAVHQPLRVGIGTAFFFGICMDVHQSSLLGQHALAYSLLSYGAVSLHRRLPGFGLLTQALHVLPLFVAAHVASLLVRMAVGGMWPGWGLALAPLFEAMLWPLACLLLLAPQRRAPDRDANRPL